MAERNAAGQFVKGRSGNPSGKPKIVEVIAEAEVAIDIEELFRNNVGMVFAQLYKTIVSPKTTDAARVAAIKEYFARTLGKPKEFAPLKVTEEELSFDLSKLPTDTLNQILQLQNEKDSGGES